MTTTYKRLLLLAALPALLLASCSQEEMDGGQGTQDGAIRFEIGFAPQTDTQTRVATDTQFESTWENGDAIGIFAVKHGKELAASGNYIHNVKLTYRNGTWTASKVIYWPMDGTKYDFYAYYPYDPTATNPKAIAFSVPDDQCEATTGKPAYNRNDLLMAENDNNGAGFGKSNRTVSLSFTHALAMVQVKVNSSMIGSYAPDALNVWLNGCTTDCVLNLSAQTVAQPAAPATLQKIKMYPCPTDGSAPGIYAYRALVPMQTIAQGTAMFSFDYGNGNVLLRSKQLATDLSLTAGRAEIFDMTFPFTSATVSSNVRLTNLFTTDELAKITHLKVLGEMTEADFTTINNKMPNITSLDLGGATVENDAIPSGALSWKTSLNEFVFPQNIKSIGSYAFQGCSGLTGDLKIPKGVTTIYDSAFSGCSGFKGSLTIPEGVTTIGYSAFYNCSGLTGNLTIPESVKTIGASAFTNCRSFTGDLTIPKSVTIINDHTFEGCSGFNGSLTLPKGLTSIYNNAFKNCSGFKGDLTIPEKVTSIGDYAFQGCSGFNGSLTIPEGVAIGNSVFYNCSSLTGDLTIPEGVMSIGNYAFINCQGFYGSLTIPESVTSIGNDAFTSCTNLSSITCYLSDPSNATYGKDVFYAISTNIPVHVPAAALRNYQKHDVWKQFTDIKAITP